MHKISSFFWAKCFALFFLLFICFFPVVNASENDKIDTSKFTTLTSNKEKTEVETEVETQIKIPPDWVVKEGLNDVASIEAGNQLDTAFVIVISEPKTMFDEDATLEDFAEFVISAMLKRLEKGKITKGPTPTTVNGLPAIQYELQGKASKIMTTPILHTVVEGRDGFHQIMTWTTRYHWDKNRALLEAITNTFQEIDKSPKP